MTQTTTRAHKRAYPRMKGRQPAPTAAPAPATTEQHQKPAWMTDENWTERKELAKGKIALLMLPENRMQVMQYLAILGVEFQKDEPQATLVHRLMPLLILPTVYEAARAEIERDGAPEPSRVEVKIPTKDRVRVARTGSH